MWSYNYNDGNNDWLEHGALGSARANHKYIRRNFINGRWVYEYGPGAGGASKRNMAINRSRLNDLKLKRSTAANKQGPKKTSPDTKPGEWSKKHQKTTKVVSGTNTAAGAKKVAKAAKKGSVVDKTIDVVASKRAKKKATDKNGKMNRKKYEENYIRETGKLKSKKAKADHTVDKVTTAVDKTKKNVKKSALKTKNKIDKAVTDRQRSNLTVTYDDGSSYKFDKNGNLKKQKEVTKLGPRTTVTHETELVPNSTDKKKKKKK